MSHSGSDKHPRSSDEDVLRGTTLKIYRLLYREGKSMGLHEIQRALDLSSASIPQYHINKLISAGLVKEEELGTGYYVDRLVFENLIRVRRALIPFQTTYAIFFATTLIILVILLRPVPPTPLFIFSFGVNLAAVIIFAYQALRTLRRSNSI